MKKYILPLVLILFLLLPIVALCLNEWVAPTSSNDPDSAWDYESQAYDGNTGTSADSSINKGKTWGNYIELNIDTILCKTVRFIADEGAITQIDIDYYYSNDWHNIYEGSFNDEVWVEVLMVNHQYVTKARVRFYAQSATTAKLYEFAFSEFTPERTGSVEFVDVNTYTRDSETTITMAAPAATSEDDLLIAYIAKDDNIDIDETGGYNDFTMLFNIIDDSQTCLYLGWRIADSGDAGETPTEYTWTSDDEDWIGAMITYSGINTGAPIHASGSDFLDSSDTPTAPSVAFGDSTPLTAGSLVFQCFGCDFDDEPRTVPGQLTSRFNLHQAADIGGAGGDKTNLNRWVSPTGHNDPDTKWIDEEQAYDDTIEWASHPDVPGNSWGSYLELTINSMSCNKVRIHTSYNPATINQVSLDVEYDGVGNWHNIYEGVTVSGWVEKAIGSTETVTAMRMKFYNTADTPVNAAIYEADFWKEEELGTDGNTGTAVFGIPASQEWTAATLVIEAVAAVGLSIKWNGKTISKFNTATVDKWNGVD